jgi:alpha-L-rhamnosidase
MKIVKLACEYAENPLGVDTPRPRFGWTLESESRGVIQTVYRVIVATSLADLDKNTGDKWDSGRVVSDRSANVSYEGSPLGSGERCWWKVGVEAERAGDAGSDGGFHWSAPATFEMGLLNQDEWTGKWIGAVGGVPSPLLRKEFNLAGKAKRARLCISGLGWCESYLNGAKISDSVLDPCTSEYGKSVYYVIHDVTDRLMPGVNVLGLWLGNGWFSEPDTWTYGDSVHALAQYGDSPRALAQLVIEHEDGQRQTIASDATWKATGSCITQNDFWFGEVYDARLEMSGWSEASFDDSLWPAALVKESPSGVMRCQTMPPIRVIHRLRPVSFTEPRPGVYVFDFGQVFGGWASLSVRGPAGVRVSIKYSERIHTESGLVDKHGHEPPRATDFYVMRGDPEGEVYEPRFTYHPVRYVQIEGAPGALTADSVAGCVVHTDEDLSGGFECSNELVNRIHRNVRWTLTNGLFGIPLDCLYREHWAWTDPATITGSLYPRKHMPSFWTKWLRDIADSQDADGRVPDVCPAYFGVVWDAAWGGNYPLLVWYLYQCYDDSRILEEHYGGVKRVVDYMDRTAVDGIIVEGRWGDHMLPGSEPGKEELVSSETPPELVWTGYFYRAALAVSQIASRLSRESDASRYGALADGIRDAFNAKWLDPKKHVYAAGSQTAQAFPLALGIVADADRPGVVARLIRSITQEHNNHHRTGNTGTTCLIDILRDLGHGDVMWKILTNTTYPGWGFMVAEGATTIWESWSRLAECGNEESMIMWATIDEFLLNDLAGIRGPDYYGPAAMTPGFKEICIAPFVPEDLDSARGSIRTGYGIIVSSWRKRPGGIELRVDIPVNTAAKVCVPKLGRTKIVVAESGRCVWEGGAYPGGVAGITGAAERADFVVFDVGSGTYVFELEGA